MDSGKSAVGSLGFMGPVIAVVVLVLNQFVFKDNIITDADVTTLIDAVTTFVGLITGAIGRLKATKQITTVLPGKP